MLPDDFCTASIWQEGDPEKIFVLPFLGEFGCYLTTYVHDFHRLDVKEKVIAIRPRHKILFPTATDFFYDWDIEILDEHKDGVNRTNGPKRIILKLMKRVIEEYPQYADFTFISPFGHYNSANLPYKGFNLPKLNDIPLHPDITICARNRVKRLSKNIDNNYWINLIEHLNDNFYTVASAGEKHTSVQDLPVIGNSWDYHYGIFDINCSINLMQNSKVVVTTNTGGMHLANMCNKDIIILCKSKGMLPHVEAIQKDNRILLIYDSLLTEDKIPYVVNIIDLFIKGHKIVATQTRYL